MTPEIIDKMAAILAAPQQQVESVAPPDIEFKFSQDEVNAVCFSEAADRILISSTEGIHE